MNWTAWGLLAVVVLVIGARNETMQGVFSMQSRGIRNNNPGNIRHGGSNWRGQSEHQPDPEFVRFTSPVWGIRALARTLKTYKAGHGLETVQGIIRRWAPPVGRDSEGQAYRQDTGAYVRHVSSALGVRPDEPLTFHTEQIEALVRTMIAHENGQQPYTPEQIREGIRLAGWVA